MAAKTIMLVDDESINNLIHKRILLQTIPKLHILEFTDPTEALAYITENREPVPDIIFLDIYMPEMYAWDFLDALPEDGPIPKIYICTGSEDFRDTEKVFERHNISGLIHKPFDSNTIGKILKS